MSILVVGSVAFDTVETPKGKVENVVAGAATYFALAASYFTEVRVVGVVGEDFGPEQEALFLKRGIDIRGIEHAPGRSFHWKGEYTGAMNEARTLDTQLNVFAEFEPKIPAEYEDSGYLFLANIDPKLQLRVRRQMPNVKMVCGDTMNYWIADHTAALKDVLKELDVLLINDGEARMLSGIHNMGMPRKRSSRWGRSRLSSSTASTGRRRSSVSIRSRAVGGFRGRFGRRRCRSPS